MFLNKFSCFPSFYVWVVFDVNMNDREEWKHTRRLISQGNPLSEVVVES